MFDLTTIKTLEDARKLLLAISLYYEECLDDCVPHTHMTPQAFAEAAEKEGVLTSSLANQFASTFSKKYLEIWQDSEQMNLLTDDMYSDIPGWEFDEVLAVFYGVVFLHDPEFRDALKNFIEMDKVVTDDVMNNQEINKFQTVNLPFGQF